MALQEKDFIAKKMDFSVYEDSREEIAHLTNLVSSLKGDPILDQKFNVFRNVESTYMQTLLTASIYRQYFNLAKILLENDADVNVIVEGYRQKWQALNWVCYANGSRSAAKTSKQLEVVKLLIEKGADIEFIPPQPSLYTWNPLGTAIEGYLDMSIVEELLISGANPRFRCSAHGQPQDETKFDSRINLALKGIAAKIVTQLLSNDNNNNNSF